MFLNNLVSQKDGGTVQWNATAICVRYMIPMQRDNQLIMRRFSAPLTGPSMHLELRQISTHLTR